MKTIRPTTAAERALLVGTCFTSSRNFGSSSPETLAELAALVHVVRTR